MKQATPKKIAEMRERTLAENSPMTSLRFPAGSLSFHTTMMGYTVNATSAVTSTVFHEKRRKSKKKGTQLDMVQSVTTSVLVLPTVKQSSNRS